eukprot:SAG31_NODE_10048_length_1191_cov_1.214286_1_plen_103_part_00
MLITTPILTCDMVRRDEMVSNTTSFACVIVCFGAMDSTVTKEDDPARVESAGNRKGVVDLILRSAARMNCGTQLHSCRPRQLQLHLACDELLDACVSMVIQR